MVVFAAHAFPLDVAPGLPAWVEGDAQKLRQVLDNLIGNACKFTEDGGEVEVAVLEGAEPALVVRDHGIGIDPADLLGKTARAFAHFGIAPPAAGQRRLF